MIKLICMYKTDQKVVPSTTILTVPGNLLCLVKASSISIDSSSSEQSSETRSSVSHSSSIHCEAEERNIPAAAACVSVGELRDAEGLFWPRELRAMRI